MRKNTMQKTNKTTEYVFAENCAGAVRSFMATVLLFYGMVFLATSILEEWTISKASFVWIQVFLFLAIVLFHVAPLCGKYEAVWSVGTELVYILGSALYFWKNFSHMKEGYQALYSSYLIPWNDYYKSNIQGYDADMTYLPLALGFTLYLLLMFGVMLRYMTKQKLFLLLPGITILSAGLLVNALPSWKGFAFYFAGLLLLFSGPYARERVAFRAKKGEHKKQERVFFRQMISLGCTAVVAVGIVLLGGTVFVRPAEAIAKNGKQFYIFQTQLEDRLKNIGPSYVETNKAEVDNNTPEYSDRKILTISAEKKPETNLYLKDFCSGRYADGTWKTLDDSYEREAKKAGYDPDHIAVLLSQNVYEQSQGNDNIDRRTTYEITYENTWSSNALVPYFMDLADSKDTVWVDKDAVVKKKRMKSSVKAEGLRQNTKMDENAQYFAWVEYKEDPDAMSWYDTYAYNHYAKPNASATDGVIRYAKAVLEDSYMDSDWYTARKDYVDAAYYGEQDFASEEAMMQYVNMSRLDLARSVKDILNTYKRYNLYLDDLAPGEDAVAYFLEEGKEGYCMHFASAATLILQELGVPARYASGYIVKRESFKVQKDRSYAADVIDRNGHAWVEIYLDGIGWIPYEVTPGYGGINADVPTSAESQKDLKAAHDKRKDATTSSESVDTETQLTEETQTQDSQTQMTQQSTQEPGENGTGGGKALSQGQKIATFAIGILIILVVLLLVLYCVVRLQRNYRNVLLKELHKKQNIRAVKRINRRIYKNVRKLVPAQFSSMTDAEYEARLKKMYPAVSKEDWEQYMRIAKKAAFSQLAISEEEVRFCYHIYKTYRKKKQEARIITKKRIALIISVLCVVFLLVAYGLNKNNGDKKTIKGNVKTYYQMKDGTWTCDDITYKYRLEIKGRMPNAAGDSTFIYLSNRKNISFEQAWRASGLGSLSEDEFNVIDAVLVEMIDE